MCSEYTKICNIYKFGLYFNYPLSWKWWILYISNPYIIARFFFIFFYDHYIHSIFIEEVYV
jgi:hypothetical protein